MTADEPESTHDGGWQKQNLREWTAELNGECELPALGRLPYIATSSELGQLFQAQDRPLFQLAWVLLYAAGLRTRELLALDRSSLIEANRLTLRRQVPLPPKLFERLSQLPSGRLFPWTAEEFEAEVQRVARSTGLLARYQAMNRRLTSALFRHAFATRQLEAGMDLFTLSSLLGHARFGTTCAYLGAAVGLWKPAYQAHHPFYRPEPDHVPERSTEESLSTRGRAYPATPTLEEIDLILRLANGVFNQGELLIRVFFATGCRSNEVAHLCAADLDLESGRVFVRFGKDDLDRYVLLDAKTADMLRQALAGRPLDHSLFGTSKDKFFRILVRIADRSGLYLKYEPLGQTITPHSFRHACATHCYRSGMAVHDVKWMLGHDRLKNTDYYLHRLFSQLETEYLRSLSPSRTAAGGQAAPRWWRVEPESTRFRGDEDEGEEPADPPDLQLLQWRAELGDELDAETLTLGQLPIIWSPAQVQRLIDSASEGRERLAWQVLSSAGVRLGELLQLRKASLVDGHLALSDRLVPLHPDTYAALHGLPDDTLFPWTQDQGVAMFVATCAAAGLAERYLATGRRAHPSALRHACAVHRLQGGLDLFQVKDLLGHQTVEITSQYLRCLPYFWRAEFERVVFYTRDAPVGWRETPRESSEDSTPLLRENNPGAALLRDEVDLLLQTTRRRRDDLLVRLLVETGARSNELLSLLYADFDEPSGTLFIRNGKGNKDRYVLLDRPTCALLLDWRADQGASQPLFEITDVTVWRVISQLGDLSGLSAKYDARGLAVSPHGLRHTFATLCFEAGMSPRTLQLLLGHQFLETTSIYVERRFPELQRRYLATCGKLLEPIGPSWKTATGT